MEVGTEKCAMLKMEKGKSLKTVSIDLLDGKVIQSLQKGESYKYFGMLGGGNLIFCCTGPINPNFQQIKIIIILISFILFLIFIFLLI